MTEHRAYRDVNCPHSWKRSTDRYTQRDRQIERLSCINFHNSFCIAMRAAIQDWPLHFFLWKLPPHIVQVVLPWIYLYVEIYGFVYMYIVGYMYTSILCSYVYDSFMWIYMSKWSHYAVFICWYYNLAHLPAHTHFRQYLYAYFYILILSKETANPTVCPSLTVVWKSITFNVGASSVDVMDDMERSKSTCVTIDFNY